MSNASNSYINMQVQAALIEVEEESGTGAFGDFSDVATAFIEALEDRGIELRPTMTPIQLTYDGLKTMSPFGVLGNGHELDDVVLIDVWVVAMCATKRQRVCGFAQRLLRGGTGYVTRGGMLVLQNESRHVVYELFPAIFPDATHLYVGVKRSDRDL